jgi:hypothetical protein
MTTLSPAKNRDYVHRHLALEISGSRKLSGALTR